MESTYRDKTYDRAHLLVDLVNGLLDEVGIRDVTFVRLERWNRSA